MNLLNLRTLLRRRLLFTSILLLSATFAFAQAAPAPQQPGATPAQGADTGQTAPPQETAPAHPAVHSHRPPGRPPVAVSSALCVTCVRQNLQYLAGPALHGRGSGTEDEHHAAEYIAGKLKSYGLAPAAENGQYIQVGTLQSRKVTAAPKLTFNQVTWTHGKEFVLFNLTQPEVSGPMQQLDLSGGKATPKDVQAGAVVLLKLKPGTSEADMRKAMTPYLGTKAALLIVEESSDGQKRFQQAAARMPRMPQKLGDNDSEGYPSIAAAKPEAFEQLWSAPPGTRVTVRATVSDWQTSHTWNVLAKLEGTTEKEQIILFSAHSDHLGVHDGKTYYGADDDASGTVAVMELARAMARGQKPQRTVIFALWGSEEAGLVGARYFLAHPTFELKNIVANLEFEMIARPDPKVREDQLWLTGWDRTNLGPELAKHGAKLVGDPHPEQQFFMRSDNFALAKQGIVAQTASSYGLHKDYHQPTDTLDKVNWEHLDAAIGSMIGPAIWLANSDFKPEWNAGKKP